jgi:hypothetical protein
MEHSPLVSACRFSWGHSDSAGTHNHTPEHSPVARARSVKVFDSHSPRFSACRGRLYHMLECGHRVQTDLVEDCGRNCLDPQTPVSEVPFYCHTCLEKEAAKMWSSCESELQSAYPPLERMTKDVFDSYYDNRRRVEGQFARERHGYERDIASRSRPTIACDPLGASKGEEHIAAVMEQLSLSMVASKNTICPPPIAHNKRVNLPTDASERLHFDLNALNLDCGE